MALPATQQPQGFLPESLREVLRVRAEGELGLPLLPDVACRVMAACEAEDSDLRELAELVTHDQALAAHMLRVANSIAYAGREPVLSLAQALARLGLSTVSDIAIAVAVKQRVFAVPGYEKRMREIWLHSTATACYAKEIAALLGRDLESAFLCGLLHDVGMPIAMQAVRDALRERGVGSLPAEFMEGAMDEFHAVFGTKLAQRWRLGPWISAAITHHHAPERAKFLREEVLVTALADVLAHWAAEPGNDEPGFSAQEPLVQELGLGGAELASLFVSRQRVLGTARAFL